MGLEDRNLSSYIYDKYKLALDTGMKINSKEFYPGNIWTNLEDIKKDLLMEIKSIEIFPNSERRQLSFIPKELDYYEIENPVKLIKLSNLSNFRELEHKDFLGAIMSLGIKRELLSDLILKEQSCYFATNEIIAKLIQENLNKVGKTPVNFSYIKREEIPEINFEYLEILSSSMRLDAVISSLCKISRSEALNKIIRKEVSVDYRIKTDKKLCIKENNVISIKKQGKYIFQYILGKSKKDKLKLSFKKFN